MSEPWTPGPWEDADYIGQKDFASSVVLGGGVVLAWVSKHAAEHDARLIALAPEMAELLSGILDGATLLGTGWHDEAVVLLRRARGIHPPGYLRGVHVSEPWTPGPWEVEEHMPGGFAVRSHDGMVAGIIAFREDARLFALAPEMAELLERWNAIPSTTVLSIHRDTRALLARARGTE